MFNVAPAGHPFTVYALHEEAVTLEFGQAISEETLQQISNFSRLIQQHPFPGFYTAVPAYTTLSIFYDPLQVAKAQDMTGTDSFDKVRNYLLSLPVPTATAQPAATPAITLPVCYGGEFGPDLDELARLHQLTTAEVIRLHSSAVYKVYLLGFTLGFAYLGGLPEVLGTPRKATPRKAVPAGSVGIAGQQTGIYPLETPGGWQIIGRTPVQLFNPSRAQPALLQAGNQVRFEPVSAAAYERYNS